MLAVLMSGSGADRARPQAADAINLIRNAVRLHLAPHRPRPPRTVAWAVRLMVLAAGLELAAMITVIATRDSVHAAILAHDPRFTAAQWHSVVVAHLLPIEIGAPVAACLWLWVARANRRGRGWGRAAVVAALALNSVSLLSGLAEGSAIYARADLIAGGALWLTVLAAFVLVCDRRSSGHYGSASGRRRPAGLPRPAATGI